MSNIVGSLVLLAVLAAGALAEPIYRQYTLGWSGGFSGCSNCNSADSAFACSNGVGNWNMGLQKVSFAGLVPYGYVLTGVTSTMLGTYNCLNVKSKSIVGVYVAGVPIDIQRLDGSSQCKCGTCDGPRTYANTFFRGGWPLVNYNSSNLIRVEVDPLSQICLSSLSLNFTFEKPTRKLFTLNLVANSTGTFGTCNPDYSLVCNSNNFWGSGKYDSNTIQKITIPFVDPVGPLGRVVAIDAIAYGQWGSLANYPLKFYVNGQLINSASEPALWDDSCRGCGGAVHAYTTQPFQFGWPNYVSGGTNDFSVILDRLGSPVSPIAVSRVSLTFTYIQ